MRILTYKLTHLGDPGPDGRFGTHDCMGRVRNYAYDAVIGVGGIGKDARIFEIDRKICWVGIAPIQQDRLIAINSLGQKSVRGFVLTFDKFLFLGKRGPLLDNLAPRLAKRMYDGRTRFLLDNYGESEHAEATAILQWSVNRTPPQSFGSGSGPGS